MYIRKAFRRVASGRCSSRPCNGTGPSTSGHKGIQGGTQVVRRGYLFKPKPAQRCDLLVMLYMCCQYTYRCFAGSTL